MTKFLSCERGNFAVAFAIALVPLFGAIGLALDYNRATHVQSFVQNHADAAALAGAQSGPTGDPSAYLAFMRTAISERYGSGGWVNNLEMKGVWLSQTDFQVTASGGVPITFLAAVPGVPREVKIGVVAVVRIADPKFIYGRPSVTQLDPDAGDYNRISVYCFDPKTSGDRTTKGRTQMTVIADNAGTKYNYVMPDCAAGQMMSYKLLNVRDSRTKPAQWDKKTAERYEYFTDTTIKFGAEAYDLGNWDILETVLCNKIEECRPKSQGGILPEGAERIPQRTNKVCSPGKYMYYGWEDRPPGSGWTDRDYNDIRIIIGCPTVEEVGKRSVRLTQ